MRRYQFGLRRFLSAVVVVAVLLAVAGDANRRCKRAEILFISLANQTDAESRTAMWHFRWLIADVAVLVGGGVGIAMWLALRVQD